MTYFTSTAADAKTIRQEIKAELGHNTKAVSVRTSNYSMGSSIRVIIKKGVAVSDLDAITRIAKKKECVRRCHKTGEVLSGGNQHVTIDIDSSACKDLITPDFFAAVQKAVSGLKAGEFEMPITEKVSLVSHNNCDTEYEILTEVDDARFPGEFSTHVNHIYSGCTDEEIAERLSIIIATSNTASHGV
mgnify:FL=1